MTNCCKEIDYKLVNFIYERCPHAIHVTETNELRCHLSYPHGIRRCQFFQAHADLSPNRYLFAGGKHTITLCVLLLNVYKGERTFERMWKIFTDLHTHTISTDLFDLLQTHCHEYKHVWLPDAILHRSMED